MSLQLFALPGIPLIGPGDDLSGIILKAVSELGMCLENRDILVIAQKIISKCEGRYVNLETVMPSRDAFVLAKETCKDPRIVELILRESKKVLRRRPGAVIVEHRLGFICASAGIDHSNVLGPHGEPQDWVLLLPEDPDASAHKLRLQLESASGKKLGVLIIDSHGRAWRMGTVGVAIGLSGLPGLVDMRGWKDLYNYELQITQVGAADELAAAASLVMGQAAEGTPIVLARGFPFELREGSLSELIRPEEIGPLSMKEERDLSANSSAFQPPYQQFTDEFWTFLDRLVLESEIVIDRPRGSVHPHFQNLVYPFDYGYLEGTMTMDGCGLDAWVGSCPDRILDAVALTVDLEKRDVEVKLLLGCTKGEKLEIIDFLNGFSMRACMVQRGDELGWLKSRRSVRTFQPRVIPEELLIRLLETSTWAPSAHNHQPWRFAVLQTKTSKEKLVNAMEPDFRRDLDSDGLTKAQIDSQVKRSRDRILAAPVAIVLCMEQEQGFADIKSARQQAETIMSIQSVALAGGYLLLAAHFVGLAGVWICAPLFTPDSVQKALKVPPNWLPQALILLGYPASPSSPRSRKPIKEITQFL